MTDPDLTHIVAVLDRSFSMSSQLRQTKEGWDSFVEEQKKQPGECKVTLVQFDAPGLIPKWFPKEDKDDWYQVVYENLDINDVPKLVLQPRGNTALRDAVGKAITDKGKELARLPEEQRPGKVLVFIFTDGEENSSRQFSESHLRSLIDQQTNQYGWVFTYLGSNQDAVAVAASMGIDEDNALTYDGDAAPVAFAAASASTVNYRSTGTFSAYSNEQRLTASGLV